jgi:uncharacterized protein involved in exopolysaccharide biosynthesis
VIEPPGSNDVRTATAVSPIYLESLKTYERFATSDSLFQRAAERFHLRDAEGAQSIESLKRRVLKVSKIRDTKILELSVTLAEPKLAQGLVEYLANETVAMSRSENLAADRELLEDIDRQLTDADGKLAKAKSAWSENNAKEPTDGLRSQIDAETELLTKTRQELIAAEGDVAEYEARDKSAPDGSDRAFVKQQSTAARARVASLEHRIAELQRTIADQGETVAQRSARHETLQMDLKTAQALYDGVAARRRDLNAAAGIRGERLRVIDPGIVPQRPVSPNIPLNVLAALFAAIFASLVYLSFAFAFDRHAVRREMARR